MKTFVSLWIFGLVAMITNLISLVMLFLVFVHACASILIF